jgi:CheY-like chemotaxis protein
MARILVADDDENVLSLVRLFLEDLGHEVKTEGDGLKAGLSARQWRPDLLVSDIQMPNFYGTTAVVGLRQWPETAAIPVIFVSAVAPATVEKMLELIRTKVEHPELIRFVPKPIDFKLLETFVRELLG